MEREKRYSVALTEAQLQLLSVTIDEHNFAGRYAELVAGVKEALRQAAPMEQVGEEPCPSSQQ